MNRVFCSPQLAKKALSESKAKLLLSKIAMSGANVLILDEPTRNFSPLSGPVIRRMLAGFKGAVISVSHDRKFIEEVCDKGYILTEEGGGIERGNLIIPPTLLFHAFP